LRDKEETTNEGGLEEEIIDDEGRLQEEHEQIK
jgi:hypothetical protein